MIIRAGATKSVNSVVKSTSRRIKSINKRPAGKAAPRKPAAPAKAPPKKPSTKAPAKSKWVFGFGNGKAEGRVDMRNLLGGNKLWQYEPQIAKIAKPTVETSG